MIDLPPVEVTVSKRCSHNCFAVSVGSKSVWHVVGVKVYEADPEYATVFHLGHQEHEGPCGDETCLNAWDIREKP